MGERTSAGEWGVSSNEGFEFAPDTVEGVPGMCVTLDVVLRAPLMCVMCVFVVTVLQRLEGTFVDFSNQFSILMNLFNQQVYSICGSLNFLHFLCGWL